MSKTSSVIDQARALLEERLAELDSERGEIQRALAELGGSKSSAKRGPGRPKGSGSKGSKSAGGRRRRRRRGGTRAEQAMKLISAEPGLTASQIAEQLGIKPNYVYRVLSELESEGKLLKRGKGYHPVDRGSQASAPAVAEAATQLPGDPAGEPPATEAAAGSPAEGSGSGADRPASEAGGPPGESGD